MVITNPKDAQYLHPGVEPLGRIYSSTHIRCPLCVCLFSSSKASLLHIRFPYIHCYFTHFYTAYSLAHLLQLLVIIMARVDGVTTVSADCYFCGGVCALQDPGLFSSFSYRSVCECGWRGPGESRVCRGTSVCAALGPQSLLHGTAYHHSQSRGK